MNRLVRWCVATLLIATAPLIAMAAVPNYQGMWYNAPAESEAGWGINFAHQGDAIFATWFTHDANGQAWNLSLSAFQTSANTFAGNLVVVTGPPFGTVPFDPTQVHATPVGNGTLTFSDSDHGTFSYTVNGVQQAKSITKQLFGVAPTCTWNGPSSLAAATNYQDMWWVVGGTESGWGINFAHQSDAIFATWFTYDLAGAPLPMSATLFKTGPSTYSGTLIKTSGPPFSAASWNPAAVTRTELGTATVTFANGNRATFTYTVALNGPMSGVTQTKQLERQVFREPGTICAEPGGGVATAEGIWRGTTDLGQPVTVVILDDGTFYIVFSAQGTTTEAGVLHGSGSSVNGNFDATSIKEYPLSPSKPPLSGGAAAIHGTYVPRTTLQLTIGSSSVTASYDPTYDQPGNLASLAGTYQGFVGHITEQAPAMSIMDSGGNLTISGTQCVTAVSATPRGTVNMFNISVSSSSCYNGPGIMFYDSAGKKLYALAAFYNGLLGFPDMWYAIGTRQ